MLLEETTSLNHVIRIVTKDKVLKCSGVILNKRSEVLRTLVAEEDELYLDNYNNIKDCLTVLHLGQAELKSDNIHDALKFSVEFEMIELYEQCQQWLKDNICAENMAQIYLICNGVSKFTKVSGIKLKFDVFESLSIYLRIQGEQCSLNNVQ